MGKATIQSETVEKTELTFYPWNLFWNFTIFLIYYLNSNIFALSNWEKKKKSTKDEKIQQQDNMVGVYGNYNVG